MTAGTIIYKTGKTKVEELVGIGKERFNYLQSLDNLRLSTYGIDNGGLFEKKAHKLEEEQQMIKNIEEAKEVSLKKKAIEESQKKSKYVKPTIMSAVEPIKNIPNTQLGLDECINTTG